METGKERIQTLREWRDEQGRTWVWCARQAELSYPSFIRNLRDGKFPDGALARLAAALGIAPEQIAHTAPSGSTTPEHEHPEAVDRRVKERRQTLPTEGGTR